MTARSWPMTAEEGEQTGRLGRGEAVPGGPGACHRTGCHHAKVWHEHHNRKHPCEKCGCPGFLDEDAAAGLATAPATEGELPGQLDLFGAVAG